MKKALSSRGCPKVVLSQRPEKTPLNINAHPEWSNDAIGPSNTWETRHKAQSPRGARDSLTFPSGRRIKTLDFPSAARQRPSQTSPSTLPKIPMNGGNPGMRREPASGRGVFCNSATRGSRRALSTLVVRAALLRSSPPFALSGSSPAGLEAGLGPASRSRSSSAPGSSASAEHPRGRRSCSRGSSRPSS